MAMPQKRIERDAREVPNCIAGDAQVYLDKIVDMRYPPRIVKFLMKELRKGTFDSYGWHIKKKTSEYECIFQLASWARTLEWPKPTVIQVRTRLIKANVIWFTPDPDEPGYGMIGWNTNLDEWQPIGPKGGAREGAGNPYFDEPEYQAVLTQLREKRAKSDYQRSNGTYQCSNKDLSIEKRSPAITPIKLVTPTPDEATPVLPPPPPLRKVTKKLIKTSPSGEHAPEAPPPGEDVVVVKYAEETPAYKLALYYRDQLIAAVPHLEAKLPRASPTDLAKWAVSAHALLTDCKGDKALIGHTIAYGLRIPFHAGHMTTLPKFAAKFTAISLEMQAAQRQERTRGGRSHATAIPRPGSPEAYAADTLDTGAGTSQDRGAASAAFDPADYFSHP